MGAFDLLVVGDANPDVMIGGAPAVPPYGQAETLVEAGTLALGGSAAIVAHGAARLGLSTALAAVVGRDAAGHFVLDTLSSAGVDIRAVARDERLPTALTVCLGGPGGDRAILTAAGRLASFDPRELPRARHVHAASYFLQPLLATRLADLFGDVRELGTTTSLDTNHDPAGRWELAPGLLDVCDFVLPNESEALALTGAGTVEAAMAVFAGAGVSSVVKRGGTRRDGAKRRRDPHRLRRSDGAGGHRRSRGQLRRRIPGRPSGNRRSGTGSRVGLCLWGPVHTRRRWNFRPAAMGSRR